MNKRGARTKVRQRQKVSQSETLRQFLAQFKTKGFKTGDLVLTAEVHRVVDPEWGNDAGRRYLGQMSVTRVYPRCETCYAARRQCKHEHIMSTEETGGQQSLMGFK